MGRKTRFRETERFLIGVGRIVVEISGNDELKVRRSVVAKIKDRVASTFHVSIADVGRQDVHDEVVIGVAAVSSSRDYLESILDKIPAFIEELGVCRVLSDEHDVSHF